MTTTEHPITYVAVRPAKGNGNGNPGREGGGVAPHAQPRAGARDTGSVAAILGNLRTLRPARPVTDTATDRPDLWRRAPLSLSELCERYRDDIAEEWAHEQRATAVLDVVFTGLVALPLTALGYGFAFCAQAKHRAVWLALAMACLIAYLTI